MRLLPTLLFTLAALPSLAKEAKHCVVDLRGNQVCGTRANQCDEVVCAIGACIRDVRGEITCAGKAMCAGGCVPASSAACRQMTN